MRRKGRGGRRGTKQSNNEKTNIKIDTKKESKKENEKVNSIKLVTIEKADEGTSTKRQCLRRSSRIPQSSTVIIKKNVDISDGSSSSDGSNSVNLDTAEELLSVEEKDDLSNSDSDFEPVLQSRKRRRKISKPEIKKLPTKKAKQASLSKIRNSNEDSDNSDEPTDSPPKVSKPDIKKAPAEKVKQSSVSKIRNSNNEDSDNSDEKKGRLQKISKPGIKKTSAKKVQTSSFTKIKKKLEDSDTSEDENEKNSLNHIINNQSALTYQSLKDSDTYSLSLNQSHPSTSLSVNTNSGAASSSKITKELSVAEMLAIGENMTSQKSYSDFKSSDEESNSDWEEVRVDQLAGSPSKPPESIVITIPQDGYVHSKGKRKFDIEDFVRLELNRKTRDMYYNLHKVSLLCLLGRGILLNSILSNENLLEKIKSEHKYWFPAPKYINMPYVTKLLTQYRRKFEIKDRIVDDKILNLQNKLMRHITGGNISIEVQIYMLILTFRALGMDTRLVLSLQPIGIKPRFSDLLQPKKQTQAVEDEDDGAGPSQTQSAKSQSDENEHYDVKSRKSKAKIKNPNNKSKIEKANSKSKIEKPNSKSKIEKPNSKGKIEKPNSKGKIEKPNSKTEIKINTKNEPVLGKDVWLETYLTEEERWVSIDVENGNILCDSEIEKRATQPVHYVLAFNSDGTVKDITRKYASNWLTGTVKLRVDSDWWEQTLQPYKGRSTEKDKEEDAFLDEMLATQSIPKSVTQVKGHPLYACKRHLLKYEAIYPPDAAPIGYISKEPVYPRSCVHVLHTRELWTRSAKVVRLGETPYKFVKSRPKFDKMTKQMTQNDKPTELFGSWQVEDFIPPVAQDGKVPRNAYGNVELFKNTMIPIGCVHLALPGLNRVAKKLNIDCAPALMDFEYHRGGCHGVFDGFVVCEEFSEVLVDAWNQEQDEIQKKAEKKRLDRIRGNWKKLYRGVLIQLRIKKKYSS